MGECWPGMLCAAFERTGGPIKSFMAGHGSQIGALLAAKSGIMTSKDRGPCGQKVNEAKLTETILLAVFENFHSA